MTVEQHLNWLIKKAANEKKSAEWIKAMISKYSRGYKEHNQGVWEMSEESLNQEILEESIDLWVYTSERERRDNE